MTSWFRLFIEAAVLLLYARHPLWKYRSNARERERCLRAVNTVDGVAVVDVINMAGTKRESGKNVQNAPCVKASDMASSHVRWRIECCSTSVGPPAQNEGGTGAGFVLRESPDAVGRCQSKWRYTQEASVHFFISPERLSRLKLRRGNHCSNRERRISGHYSVTYLIFGVP